ncbi:hypothetical protein ABTL98_18735, partial [Acinetobacter baumannii]
RPAALAVRFAGLDISAMSDLPLEKLLGVLRPTAAGTAGEGGVRLSEEKQLAAQRIASAVCERIGTLTELGLGYLSLNRSTPTLSPGEL